VNNIEGTRVTFSVDDCTHTSSVATSGDHAQIAGLEFDAVHDFSGVNVQTDGVVNLKISYLNA
jgi:hypothetical protein